MWDSTHFRLALEARERHLKAIPCPTDAPRYFLVSSHSRKGKFHRVELDGRCSCEAGQAGKRCSHGELAVWLQAKDSFDYETRRERDLTTFQQRLFASVLSWTENDYVQRCVRRFRHKYPRPERRRERELEAAPF